MAGRGEMPNNNEITDDFKDKAEKVSTKDALLKGKIESTNIKIAQKAEKNEAKNDASVLDIDALLAKAEKPSTHEIKLNTLVKNTKTIPNLENVIKDGEKNIEGANKIIDLFGKDSVIGKLLSWILGSTLKEGLESNKDQLALNKFKALSEKKKLPTTTFSQKIQKEISSMKPNELDDFFDTMREQSIDLSEDGNWEKLMKPDSSTYRNANKKIVSVFSQLPSNANKKQISTQLNSIEKLYETGKLTQAKTTATQKKNTKAKV